MTSTRTRCRARACGAALLVAGVALDALSAGCASGPEPRPECAAAAPIALTIDASPRMNPDAGGHALPTELRLYQVRDARALDAASFDDVWRDASAVLGDALLSEESLTLYPGDRLERELRPEDEATSIVAVVIVRQPAGRTWRAVVPMTRTSASGEACPTLRPGRVLLRLDEYRVEAITPRTSSSSGTTTPNQPTESRG